MENKVYSEVLVISKGLAEVIEDYLNTPGLQDEDDTITETVKFPDGREVDIKCCGSQDDYSWTEAVLFSHDGAQLCFTEPEDEFLGEWLLEYDGVIYQVTVKVSED